MAPSMLIVDDVCHFLAGTYREQRASLNLLKFMANAGPPHSRKCAPHGGDVVYDGDRCSPTVFAPSSSSCTLKVPRSLVRRERLKGTT
jgi:hypothetical protein